MAAARRLVERGARTLLWQEAALGLMPAIMRRIEADPSPRAETLSGPRWNSCHGGQIARAQYRVAHRAELNSPPPSSGQTPLERGEQTGRSRRGASVVQS